MDMRRILRLASPLFETITTDHGCSLLHLVANHFSVRQIVSSNKNLLYDFSFVYRSRSNSKTIFFFFFLFFFTLYRQRSWLMLFPFLENDDGLAYPFPLRFLDRYTLDGSPRTDGRMDGRTCIAIVSLIAARYLESLSDARDLLITRRFAVSIFVLTTVLPPISYRARTTTCVVKRKTLFEDDIFNCYAYKLRRKVSG